MNEMLAMTAERVVELQLLFDSVGVNVWFDGGWAVDAVVGAQTRPHEDLDIVVSSSDLAMLRHALVARGFEERPGGRESNFVLVDHSGRKVDVHVITLGAGGEGTYRMEDGSVWVFSPESLTGRGTVKGVEVRCLTPEEQVRCHNEGHEPREKDLADMAVLRTRLGVDLPPRLRRGVHGRTRG
jgi:lincosamide nucleotidyltransferase A/C/D/E